MKSLLTKKNISIGLAIVAVLLATFVVLEKTHVINIYKKNTNPQDGPSTTSDTKTAQATFTEGDPRDAGNTITENKGTGGLADTGGATEVKDTSRPIVSSTGDITVYSPQSGTKIVSGTSISGISKLNTISYRIIDDVSGVIASGELKVVEGKFSGSLSFNTSASKGRIDLFATKFDGTEYSNVEIQVVFK